MLNYSHLNYRQTFKDCRQHFKLVLIYTPRPVEEITEQVEEGISTSLNSSNSLLLQLPLAFALMSAGQIEILLTEGFGELSTETFSGRKETQGIQIQMGTSYREYIQPEELTRIRNWCKKAMHDLLHQQCQRSPKRHSMIDQ